MVTNDSHRHTHARRHACPARGFSVLGRTETDILALFSRLPQSMLKRKKHTHTGLESVLASFIPIYD